jgi:hypothetical protein
MNRIELSDEEWVRLYALFKETAGDTCRLTGHMQVSLLVDIVFGGAVAGVAASAW